VPDKPSVRFRAISECVALIPLRRINVRRRVIGTHSGVARLLAHGARHPREVRRGLQVAVVPASAVRSIDVREPPDWDPCAPGLREAWDAGDLSLVRCSNKAERTSVGRCLIRSDTRYRLQVVLGRRLRRLPIIEGSLDGSRTSHLSTSREPEPAGQTKR